MGNNNDVSLQGQETQMLGQEIEEIVDDDGEDGNDGDDIDPEDDEAEALMKSGLAKYIWHQDLEWDADGSGRLIVVGDVHGMLDQLKSFLHELEYSPDQTRKHNDTLVFVGDLVAKHPDISSSLQTVDYIRSLNAWAVRGNHDQDVLNWRTWMEATSLEGLGKHDADLDSEMSDASEQGEEERNKKKVGREEEEEEIPDNVPQVLKHKWRDEHFRIAKSMSQESADWLKKRSMTLHIRSLHTYVVHAGLLPWTIPKKKKGKGKKVHTQANDEEKKEVNGREEMEDIDFLENLDFSNEFGITPETSLMESSSETSFTPITLSSIDASSSTSSSTSSKKKKKKDLDPEIAILTVPLNREPFTLLEMRGLKKNGKVTKSAKKGEPWAPIWNQVMQGCQQTIESSESSFKKEKIKPGQCRPLNVIYGHAAARGLDLHPYSFGLDSGAVYGRSFSALVVNGKDWKGSNDDKDRKKLKKKEDRKRTGGGGEDSMSTNKLKSKKLESVDVAIAGRNAKVYSMKTKKP